MIETFDIGLVKLATDMGLGIALFYLGTRIKKPSLAPHAIGKIKALEETIKNLLQEAEQAGAGLTEDLLRRRKELEYTLSEVKDVEKKLSRDMVEADEKSKVVVKALREAEQSLQILHEKQAVLKRGETFASTTPSRSRVPEVAVNVLEDPEETYQSAPPPPPFSPAPPQKRSERRQAPQTGMQHQQHGFDTEPPSFEQRNYGRVLDRQTTNRAANPPRQQNNSQNLSGQGLSAQVEREAIKPQQEMAAIQNAAQRISVSGNALHAEAIKAALMKRKSQQKPNYQQSEDVENEFIQAAIGNTTNFQDEQSQEEALQDDRLGVLSGIRRHTQVV